MNAAIIKMLISSIGIDNIANQANSLISEGVKWAEKQPLEPGEKKVIGILYNNNDQAYFAAVTVNEAGTIMRYIIDKPLPELLQLLIQNIS